MSIRIILADDHKVLRYGLSEAIKNEDDMEAIGQAENGHEAVSLTKKLSPDVIIMDIAMPDLNGIEATRQILKEHPQIKIIALSMHSNKKLIHEMFKAGAKGYLLKDCEYDELINAVRVVTKDKVYLSPSITGVVIDNYIYTRFGQRQGNHLPDPHRSPGNKSGLRCQFHSILPFKSSPHPKGPP